MRIFCALSCTVEVCSIEQWRASYQRKFMNAVQVIAVSAGSGYTCAILIGGQVMCWGNNNYGQLGIGSTAMQAFPVKVILGNGKDQRDSEFQNHCGRIARLWNGSSEIHLFWARDRSTSSWIRHKINRQGLHLFRTTSIICEYWRFTYMRAGQRWWYFLLGW